MLWLKFGVLVSLVFLGCHENTPIKAIDSNSPIGFWVAVDRKIWVEISPEGRFVATFLAYDPFGDGPLGEDVVTWVIENDQLVVSFIDKKTVVDFDLEDGMLTLHFNCSNFSLELVPKTVCQDGDSTDSITLSKQQETRNDGPNRLYILNFFEALLQKPSKH